MRADDPTQLDLLDACPAEVCDLGLRRKPDFPPQVVGSRCPVGAFPVQEEGIVMQTDLGNCSAANEVARFMAPTDASFDIVSPPVPPEAAFELATPSPAGRCSAAVASSNAASGGTGGLTMSNDASV